MCTSRSITGQTKNGNLKGYMAPLNVAPDSTCVPPPIYTTATPGGSTAAIGSTQHDDVTVATARTPVSARLRSSSARRPRSPRNGGDCKANGTQVGVRQDLELEAVRRARINSTVGRRRTTQTPASTAGEPSSRLTTDGTNSTSREATPTAPTSASRSSRIRRRSRRCCRIWVRLRLGRRSMTPRRCITRRRMRAAR